MLILGCAAWLAAASVASDAAPAPETPLQVMRRRSWRRVWGIGAGWLGAAELWLLPDAPGRARISLGAVEARLFLPSDRLSVDLRTDLYRTILFAAARREPAFDLQAYAHLRWPVTSSTELALAPGVGIGTSLWDGAMSLEADGLLRLGADLSGQGRRFEASFFATVGAGALVVPGVATVPRITLGGEIVLIGLSIAPRR